MRGVEESKMDTEVLTRGHCSLAHRREAILVYFVHFDGERFVSGDNCESIFSELY